MEPRVEIAPRYLNVDQQRDLITKFWNYVEYAPLSEVSYLRHRPFYAFIPGAISALLAWRAGYIGFGLRRYAKARVLTLSISMMFGSTSILYSEVAHLSLQHPFTKETPWHHGFKQAMYHQFAQFTAVSGSFMLNYFIAQRSGIIIIPQKTLLFGKIPVDSLKDLYTRVRPYRYPLFASWAAGTISLFALGVAGYYQSREVLRKRFGRQTFSLVED